MTGSSSEQGANSAGLEHYLTVPTFVAGYYYRAAAPAVPGQPVRLEREPDNAADLNAILVRDADGRQLGYLPRQVAADYAALVDHGLVRLLGRLAAPGEPGYDPSRAAVNPPLDVWVYVDEVRMADLFAKAGQEFASDSPDRH